MHWFPLLQGTMMYLERRPEAQVSGPGRLGRTGYGYTRDSQEDIGGRSRGRGERRGGSRVAVRGGGRGVEKRVRTEAPRRGYSPSSARQGLKQGRGRTVPPPQILTLLEDEEEDEYYEDYDQYEDEYEEEEEEEELVWPHEVRPARTRGYPRREQEVEGREYFPSGGKPGSDLGMAKGGEWEEGAGRRW